MTGRVAAQSAPVPPRRKRGGHPAGCSAIVLVWLLALTASGHAATVPVPDPAPAGVRPDAVPGSSHSAPAKQPVSHAPVVVQQPATPTVAAPSPSPTHVSPTPAVASAAHVAKRHRHAKATHHSAHRLPPTPQPKISGAAVAAEPRTAVTATRRVAAVLTFERVADHSSLSNGELAAAALLLLLLVAASASVLRLSVRMADELPRGRLG